MWATSRCHHVTQNALDKSPITRHRARSHHLRRKSSSLKPPAGVAAASSVTSPAETLLQACRTRQVPPEQVVEALETLEKQQCSEISPSFPSCLQGTWRLLFAVPAPIASWAYVPVVENAVIDAHTGMIDLKSFVGPFCFTFSGRARFVCPESQQEGRADMVFGFDALCVEAFGLKYASQRVPKEKTYSFFYVDKGIAAANSSGTSGKVLMCREDIITSQ
jgi:hypothetical protein